MPGLMGRLPLLPCSCLALLLPALAQDPPAVRLEYAFERLDGKTAVYEVETEQVVGQVLESAATGPEREKQSRQAEATTRVLERQAWTFAVTADGGRIEVATERVEVTLEETSPEGATTRRTPKRTFASDRPGTRPPERIRALLGKAGLKVGLTVSRAGKVTAVEGVPEEGRAAYQGALLELPVEPLAPGKGWERREKQPMPPLGALEYRFRWALVTAEAGKRRLEVTIRADLVDQPAERRYETSLADQDGRGWLLLDPDGLVLESLLESRLELRLKTADGVQVQRLKNRTRQVLKETRSG